MLEYYKPVKPLHYSKNSEGDGMHGWLSGLAPAFSPGCDPGDPGLGRAWGSLHGACFSLCLSLYVSMNK